MNRPDYPKQALSIEQQIDLLSKKGLRISELEDAKIFLEWNNYYRIRSYLEVFMTPERDHFREGAAINYVKELYLFDAKLRVLLFKACHRIEVALRAQLANHFSIEFQADWYDDPNFFTENFDMDSHRKRINAHIKAARNKGVTFIVNHFDRYEENINPPAWKAIEIFPFGTLVDLFEKAKKSKSKKQIAANFALAPILLSGWLKGVLKMRNFCAHHHRLFNQNFIYLQFPKDKIIYPFIEMTDYLPLNKLYYHSCCLFYLLYCVEKNRTLQFEFLNTINSFQKKEIPYFNIRDMGFSDHWNEDPFWQKQSKIQ